MELVWKRDIRLDCKALRLKAKHADRIHYVHLPKELGIFSPSSFDEARPTVAWAVGKMDVKETAPLAEVGGGL
jgi:hypothetical protein